jgi:hypothetical protein
MLCLCSVLGFTRWGKKVERFYGDGAYDADEVHNTGVEVVVPPRENASARRGHPARRKAVREFKELGYGVGGGLSPYTRSRLE